MFLVLLEIKTGGAYSSIIWDLSRFLRHFEVILTNFRYADVMCSLLNNQFGYLIASIEREVDSPGCMPHSLSFNDVKDLFGKLLHFSRGPSINDVSSEGEGGVPPSKPIYYISLFSKLSRQGEGGGS